MIEIRNLHKSFGSNKVLRGVDLDIGTGETLVIIGRSGCGKSVLIKHIVGLLYPDEGYVKVQGRKVDEMSLNELYTLRSRFGFLFQSSALFDSMTVEENIALPLVESGRKFTTAELEKKVSEKLEMVGMTGVQKLKPAELSGGMKKRVGLARALITEPDYIFYDEPTTGLDPIMSDSIDELIKDLTDKLNVTSVVVTHDMYSVKNVANRVAMMHDGKIYFTGTPQELVSTNDRTIKEFIQRTE
ncbi:MAG: ABC transporter ATP-binding protein [Ignavibacteriota bacterium]|jgi:phospholipid/cholesterol/gamma-HCH transport system ATP-binding protein|nr:MAG: ABC transporter ATP-binding protein [Chlorobiota bacterium]MBE7475443.1 ABC transporter ATP-binding protein [Ignavibacteriales bacterium]MBL1122410.1 ABC transporter ATP-binding protein [Ignavibacteriota bacterium]MBV6421579.1 putative ribonucleotide transport ATP-binding protein mkl [Ignavibacteriaceae bacterium]MCE7857751.1 ABC transporter ATP-binding protein [Ignavibacteria bacterium CHB3]MEB2297865.1 ABC transporter ATP-binding protein [Ignavibacteria bacterium]